RLGLGPRTHCVLRSPPRPAAMPEGTLARQGWPSCPRPQRWASGAVRCPSKLSVQPAFAPERGPVVLPAPPHCPPHPAGCPQCRAARGWAVRQHRPSSAEEVMSLTGLLSIVAEDPQLQRALEYADQPGSTDADLVAPQALRPVLVAALAAFSGSGASTAR